jgi:uncharacterized membrane protein YtjA (UPF0391 family)
MLRYAIIALIVALVAFGLGFAGIGQIAWWLAGLFLVLFVVLLIVNAVSGKGASAV